MTENPHVLPPLYIIYSVIGGGFYSVIGVAVNVSVVSRPERKRL